MKYPGIFLLLLFVPVFIQAQELLSSGGGEGSSGNMAVAWSLGEPVTESFSENEFGLTQGFHQPIMYVMDNCEKPETLSFEVYPNPVSELLVIKTDAGDDFSVKLYGLRGKLLLEKNDETGFCQFSVRGLEPGVYFLELHSADSKAQTIRIVRQ
ncbi:MAG: T9SS type A sorting domain-containing protein [Bacteroidota bacterium]